MYSMLLEKDMGSYSMLQRADMIALAILNGITALAMWLVCVVAGVRLFMGANEQGRLTNRYPTNVDASVAAVIFAIETGEPLSVHLFSALTVLIAGTTIFTIQPNSMACSAFHGGNMCRNMMFATAVVNWSLCGLLFLFGASVAILACRPSPETQALRSLTMSPTPRPTSVNSLTRLIVNDVEKQAHMEKQAPRPPPRMHNPYSAVIDPNALYRTDTRKEMAMAPQPMMTPRPMGPPRPHQPATRPTVVVPPRVALAQRMPSMRGAVGSMPRVAPAPPHITNPAERAAVVKAGGGMEWRKLVLDAQYL